MFNAFPSSCISSGGTFCFGNLNIITLLPLSGNFSHVFNSALRIPAFSSFEGMSSCFLDDANTRRTAFRQSPDLYRVPFRDLRTALRRTDDRFFDPRFADPRLDFLRTGIRCVCNTPKIKFGHIYGCAFCGRNRNYRPHPPRRPEWVSSANKGFKRGNEKLVFSKSFQSTCKYIRRTPPRSEFSGKAVDEGVGPGFAPKTV